MAHQGFLLVVLLVQILCQGANIDVFSQNQLPSKPSQKVHRSLIFGLVVV
jgi:hypothetical protein